MLKITTDSKNINRRSVLAAATALAATTATASVPTEPTPTYDPLPEWWQKYQFVSQRLDERSEEPGNGNFDTPEMLELSEEKDWLERLISESAPTTLEGAAAQLEFVNAEIEAGVFWNQHPVILDRVITLIRGSA